MFNAAVEDMIIVLEDFASQSLFFQKNPTDDNLPVSFDQSVHVAACTSSGQLQADGSHVVRNVPVAEYKSANATAGGFVQERVRATIF